MPKSNFFKVKDIDKRFLIIAAVVAFGLFLIIPKVPSLHDTYSILLHSNPLYIALAIFSMGCTFPAAAGVYVFLSKSKLFMLPTTIISLAAIFVNKLLPSSAGTVALNIRYLSKHDHTVVQASSIVAVNNVVGLIGHLTILMIVAFVSRKPLWQLITVRPPHIHYGFVILFLVIIFVLVYLILRYKKKLSGIVHEIKQYMKLLLDEPRRLFGSIGCAMLITSFYAFALYFSAAATGHNISVLDAYYVLTIGVITSSIIPTPGGIGGAEIGIIAALASLGIFASWAISIAIIYRLITYWLPIIPGFLAFGYSGYKRYI